MKGVAKSSNDAHFGKNIVMIESSMNLVEIEEDVAMSPNCMLEDLTSKDNDFCFEIILLCIKLIKLMPNLRILNFLVECGLLVITRDDLNPLVAYDERLGYFVLSTCETNNINNFYYCVVTHFKKYCRKLK